jgi:hypothetical protein
MTTRRRNDPANMVCAVIAVAMFLVLVLLC